MTWVAVGVGVGGGALVGALKAQQEQRNQKAAMMANAAQIENSPWTGMKTNVMGPTAQSEFNGALGGALQGGLTGKLIGSQLANQPAQAAASAPQATSGGLGSTDYARQLGQQADQFQASQSAYMGLQPPNMYSRGLAGR